MDTKETIEALFEFLEELLNDDSISKEDIVMILKELFDPANVFH